MRPIKQNTTTDTWAKYENGINYKTRIGLFETINKNERFYSGRQWEGVKSNGLPTTILNITKRIVDFKVSNIMSELLSMRFSANYIPNGTENPLYQEITRGVNILSEYSRTQWENSQMDFMNLTGLLNAALSGDMVSYWYIDKSIKGINGQKGDICGHLVDSVNLILGDPNTSVINTVNKPVQPYVIIAYRDTVSNVREKAKKYGLAADEMDKISSDTEYTYQAGDLAKVELEGKGDDGKCIVLLHMWKVVDDEGQYTIMAKESTKNVDIRPEWDMKVSRYPVALMNWDTRKGSCHGEAEATKIVPNNIIINQIASMIALWIKLHGYPKVIYDRTKIQKWNNNLSEAIAINGTDTGGVGGAAQYMQPAQLSAAVQTFFSFLIQITKDMNGANDSALGEANPTNTSAIVFNSKQATVPLSAIKARYYNYIQDVGLIWLDLWIANYGEYPAENPRVYPINIDGAKMLETFDINLLKDQKMNLKIDVGPSNQWNEAAQITTLDNLLKMGKITDVEYFKRTPSNILPDKDGLIAAREGNDDKPLLYELMARFIETLPPEQRQQIMKLPPEQMEEAVKAIIMSAQGGMGNGMSGMPAATNQGQA